MTKTKIDPVKKLAEIEKQEKALAKEKEKTLAEIEKSKRGALPTDFKQVVNLAVKSGLIKSWDKQRSNEDDYFYAHRQLVLITSVLNEGWRPNFENFEEFKYYPWFSAYSGFAFDGTRYDFEAAGTGSRLCFKNGELAEFAGQKFTDIYKKFMF